MAISDQVDFLVQVYFMAPELYTSDFFPVHNFPDTTGCDVKVPFLAFEFSAFGFSDFGFSDFELFSDFEF